MVFFTSFLPDCFSAQGLRSPAFTHHLPVTSTGVELQSRETERPRVTDLQAPPSPTGSLQALLRLSQGNSTPGPPSLGGGLWEGILGSPPFLHRALGNQDLQHPGSSPGARVQPSGGSAPRRRPPAGASGAGRGLRGVVSRAEVGRAVLGERTLGRGLRCLPGRGLRGGAYGGGAHGRAGSGGTRPSGCLRVTLRSSRAPSVEARPRLQSGEFLFSFSFSQLAFDLELRKWRGQALVSRPRAQAGGPSSNTWLSRISTSKVREHAGL